VLDLLLPTRCALCATTGTALCTRCLVTLPPAPDRAPPPGFEASWSLFSYDGPTKDLIAALKFRHHRDAFGMLGSAMADLLPLAQRRAVEAVTWAPTTAVRRRGRGYDQAEQLARAVAERLGRPCYPMLGRDRGDAQTGRTRAQRLDGTAFSALGVATVGSAQPLSEGAPSVVVVDDVRTTGSTLVAAADALTGAGVSRLIGLTLAVTL